MRRSRTTGACFTVRDGALASESPYVHLCSDDALLDPAWSGVILAVAEPVEAVPGAEEVAGHLMAGITDACRGAASDSVTDTVYQAIEQANARLFRANERLDFSRRIYLGLTVAVLSNDLLVAAQVSPSQFAMFQDGRLYTLPPTDGRQFTPASPLGFEDSIEPRISHTRVAEGDLVLAMSTTLSRSLNAMPERRMVTPSIIDVLDLVLTHSERSHAAAGHGALLRIPRRAQGNQIAHPAEGTFEDDSWHRFDGAHGGDTSRFETVARIWDTQPLDPLAPSVQTECAHGSTDARSIDNGSESSEGPAATHISARVLDHDTTRRSRPPVSDDHSDQGARPGRTTTNDEDGRPTTQHFVAWRSQRDAAFAANRSGSPHATESHPGTARTSASGPQRRRLRGMRLVELLAGLVLSLTAAVVGAWQVTRRDRPLHGPLDDGSLGLPRLQRWDESYKPPRMQRIRSRLPRLEVSRIAILVIILAAIVAAGVYYVNRNSTLEQQNAAEALTTLQRAEAKRVQAGTLADPKEAYLALLEADELARSVALDGEEGDQVAGVRDMIAADIARVTKSHRLSSVQIVGGIPSAPAGVQPRLVSGGGKLYLLSDGVYQVDVFASTLILLLKPGDIVGGAEVGTILGAAWREDRLIAVDATRSYALDITSGAWVAEQLSLFDERGYDDVAAVATFDRNLYMLTPESNQILKFQSGAYDMPPEDWTAGVSDVDLSEAVDMTIDGHVLVLLADGTIVDLFRSRLEGTIKPQVIPEMSAAVALAAPPESNFIYVLNADDGRIIRLRRDGGEVVQQLTAPLSNARPILSDAMDLTIDEAAGVAYILAGNTIFTARLPVAQE